MCFCIDGVSKPLKLVVRHRTGKLSPTVGWRVANILNKPTIPTYSFEPPTALFYNAVFCWGIKDGTDVVFAGCVDDALCIIVRYRIDSIRSEFCCNQG